MDGVRTSIQTAGVSSEPAITWPWPARIGALLAHVGNFQVRKITKGFLFVRYSGALRCQPRQLYTRVLGSSPNKNDQQTKHQVWSTQVFVPTYSRGNRQTQGRRQWRTNSHKKHAPSHDGTLSSTSYPSCRHLGHKLPRVAIYPHDACNPLCTFRVVGFLYPKLRVTIH